MEAFIEKLIAFIEKVKDDPGLSELFRAAANELHHELSPQPSEPVAQPEPVTQPEQTEPPVEPAAPVEDPPPPPVDAPVPPTEG